MASQSWRNAWAPQPLHTGPSNRSKSGSGYIWLAKATIDLISAERQVAAALLPESALRAKVCFGRDAVFRWADCATDQVSFAGKYPGKMMLALLRLLHLIVPKKMRLLRVHRKSYSDQVPLVH